jgi:hypothetical protein
LLDAESPISVTGAGPQPVCFDGIQPPALPFRLILYIESRELIVNFCSDEGSGRSRSFVGLYK